MDIVLSLLLFSLDNNYSNKKDLQKNTFWEKSTKKAISCIVKHVLVIDF